MTFEEAIGCLSYFQRAEFDLIWESSWNKRKTWWFFHHVTVLLCTWSRHYQKEQIVKAQHLPSHTGHTGRGNTLFFGVVHRSCHRNRHFNRPPCIFYEIKNSLILMRTQQHFTIFISFSLFFFWGPPRKSSQLHRIQVEGPFNPISILF